jgi:hypothetical protein
VAAPFVLHGTDSQRAIVQAALARCTYPFRSLVPGLQAQKSKTTIPVEWADLSRYAAIVAESKASGGHAHVHEYGDTGHPIEARERVLGLAWYSGRISLDLTLEQEPELAGEVLLSEGAHMIDFFAMSDTQRDLIYAAFHGGEMTEHGHGWWDEGTYREWVGEALMGGVVRAYSDYPVTIPFVHPPTDEAVAGIRRAMTPYYGLTSSAVVHDQHRGIPAQEWFTSVADFTAQGRRPCRVCKP